MARFAASLLAASLVVSILGATAFTQTAQRPPWRRESAKTKQKRAECEEQAQKLLDDADKRAYMKECISNL